MSKRIFTAIGAAALAIATFGPAAAATVPSYATGDEQIRGTISGFNGKYGVFVRDERGYVDNVTLHDGTIINPTGLSLASGMSVTILGHARGSTFEANEIDTPYHVEPGVVYAPAFAPLPYYGGYGYPYGYGYGYPYGATFGFGGGYHHGWYRR